MSKFPQSHPLSQAGPRRRDSGQNPDAVIRGLLLLDCGVPMNRIIDALEKALDLGPMKSQELPRSRAA